MRSRVVGFWLAGVMSALLAAWFLAVPDNVAPPSADISKPRVEASTPRLAPPQVAGAPAASRQPSRAVLTRVTDALPLRFEANVGQTDERARFIARGSRSTLFLTSSEAVLALSADDGRQSALTLSFAGATGSPAVSGEQQLPGRTHYLRGTESEWKRDIASYARVRYEAVYPGVDVVFYGKERELEFDVVVAPEADPTKMAIEIAGATRAHIDDAGDLMLDLSAGQVRMKRPVAYQDVRGERRPVESDFVLSGNRVGFRVGDYDRSEPLVIDPVILFSTYLGGNSNDDIWGIGLDASGNVYVSGRTSSFDFPTAAALDNRLNGPDAFVAKLAPDGSSLIYSTYLGGADDAATHHIVEMDEGLALAVDSAGHAYVTGRTNSPDFPLTPGAYDSTPNGRTDVFLTKLSVDGSALLYSTLIGTSGDDHGLDVAVDDSGSAYVLGQVGGPAFPLTPDAYSPSASNGGFFLSRFNTMAAGAASLEYSTFTGISEGGGFGLRMDIAPDGDVLIAGDFLFVNAVNGFQASRAVDPVFGFPSGDAAFLRVDPRAADPTKAVVYASYIGGSASEVAKGIGAGAGDLVCVVGSAASADFPVRNAFQTFVAGQNDAFVAVFDTSQQADASLVYSTLLGGFGMDEATHCEFDAAGVVRVAGDTFSTDFPVRAPFQATSDGSGDLFLANFDRSLAGDASLVTSSYYGGSRQEITRAFALDGAGGIWVGGTTTSTNLPLEGAIRTNLRGHEDGFLARIGEPGGGGGGEPEFLVSAIAPGSGGSGLVTTVVHGTGFVSGATVQLRRNGVLIAAAPVKFISANALQAVFNLTGAATGAWDIVVTNPGGQAAVRAGAFQIEPRTPTIRASVSVVMNPVQRAGRPTRGYITYSNPTNVDVMLPIFVYFPRGTTLQLGIPIGHGLAFPTDGPVDFSEMPMVFDTGTEQVMPLMVNVPPGHTGVIPFTIPEGCDPLNPRAVRAAIGTPQPSADAMACGNALVQFALGFIPFGDCLGDVAGLVATTIAHFTGAPQSLGSWVSSLLMAFVKCATDLFPPSAVIKKAITITSNLALLAGGWGVYEDCASNMQPTGVGSTGVDRSCVQSADPNAKYGPVGAGEAHYLAGVDAMTYAIAFENLSTATAAAQDVVVTDTLDPARLTLDTFVLGPISFGGRLVTPPAGLSTFTTTVDLRPGVNLLLGIDARLDRTTNIATWRFTSLDPVTGQPTTDPIAGFLPPNVISPEGEGMVMFTVAPVATLATQDVIRNSASIVFDVNAPIDTGEWTNAIDKMAPASTVSPLTSPRSSPSFEVQWSGTDVGSGVNAYTVFASVNGGPFSPWLSNTTATSATYQGAPGNSYGFFSIASDGVGLEEAAKTTAEALVEIALDSQPPTTSASAPQPNAAGWLSVNQAIIALTAVDGDSGVREIVYRASGATTLPATTVAGAAASVAISLEGETTVAFYAVDNAGNIESEQSLVIRIDRTAPQVTCASNPGVLWPPNQKMVDVATSVNVSDALSGAAAFTLVSATSNETDDAFDDLQGWVIGSSDSSGRLRAERMGGGEGRVYSLHYQGSDAAGNTATCSASFIVPHDRRR